MIMSVNKDKELYLKQYPEIRKWLNTCIICQSIGYKPELPSTIYPGLLAENIRKYLSLLKVNDISVCEECDQHMAH
jgi:hypothetical protein